MPTVSLRLSDAELEQLRAWAQDGKRSLQKEIVFRLFSEQVALDASEAAHEARVASGADTRFDEQGERAKVDAEWLKRRAGKTGKTSSA